MLFYMTILNLARYLTEDALGLKGDELDFQVINTVNAWKYSIFLCWNNVLNGSAYSLYNLYRTKKMSKELWESPDRKYRTEDV